jgi:hypothetical protein
LPIAAPKKIARRALPMKNMASQNEAHIGSFMCERSSMERPRIIKSHSTMMSGR